MSERVSLGLDDMNEEPTINSIDLEELAGNSSSQKPNAEIKKTLEKEGAKHGFTSRQPSRRFDRRRSPYTEQVHVKTREGMRDIFQELGDRLGLFGQETFEVAIFALIKKEGYQDLLSEYYELLNGNVSNALAALVKD